MSSVISRATSSAAAPVTIIGAGKLETYAKYSIYIELLLELEYTGFRRRFWAALEPVGGAR